MITSDIDNMEGMVARPLFKAYHGFFTSPAYLVRSGPITRLDQWDKLDGISVDRIQRIPFIAMKRLFGDFILSRH